MEEILIINKWLSTSYAQFVDNIMLSNLLCYVKWKTILFIIPRYLRFVTVKNA